MNSRPVSANEKKEIINNKLNAINAFASTAPERLKHSKPIQAWNKYYYLADSLHPTDQTGAITGMIYHIDTCQGDAEEKKYFTALKSMLDDYKSEFDENYVQCLMNERSSSAVYEASPYKDDKQRLREQLDRLSKEKQQAEKNNDKRETARLNTLISQCELCLFRKPIKDREVNAQKNQINAVYVKALTGSFT